VKRILVIRGGAIGDFVLTLPAVQLLRDAFPNARLEILGYRHIAALAEKRFYAEATRSIEYSALAGFFAKGGQLDAELARYFESFDLVVSYLFDPGSNL
jgi:heptosyltransferase-2